MFVSRENTVCSIGSYIKVNINLESPIVLIFFWGTSEGGGDSSGRFEMCSKLSKLDREGSSCPQPGPSSGSSTSGAVGNQ